MYVTPSKVKVEPLNKRDSFAGISEYTDTFLLTLSIRFPFLNKKKETVYDWGLDGDQTTGEDISKFCVIFFSLFRLS